MGEKHLMAVKCKDGWLVKITDTEIVRTESGVRVRARQAGLKVTQHFKPGDADKTGNETILAD